MLDLSSLFIFSRPSPARKKSSFSALPIYLFIRLTMKVCQWQLLKPWLAGCQLLPRRLEDCLILFVLAVNGLLVPAGQPDQLANAIHQLVVDPQMRYSMQTGSFRLAQENFDIEKLVSGCWISIKRYCCCPSENPRLALRRFLQGINAVPHNFRL